MTIHTCGIQSVEVRRALDTSNPPGLSVSETGKPIPGIGTGRVPVSPFVDILLSNKNLVLTTSGKKRYKVI